MATSTLDCHNAPPWKACRAVKWRVVFRDTRMPVSAVFENIEAGATIEEIIDQFDITRNRS